MPSNGMGEQPAFDFGMTDLEEQFAGQNGASIRMQVAEKLSTRAEELLWLMNAGLSREDFQKATCIYIGLAAACDVITIPMKRPKNIR